MALTAFVCIRLEYFFFNFEFYLPSSYYCSMHLMARYGVGNLGQMFHSLLLMTLLDNSKWKKHFTHDET